MFIEAMDMNIINIFMESKFPLNLHGIWCEFLF
jgi:hypothetical protein